MDRQIKKIKNYKNGKCAFKEYYINDTKPYF